MWMPRASCCPTLVELPDLQFELFLLAREVPLVGDHKFFACGAILPERLFISVDGLEKWSDQPPHKDPWQIQPSRGYVYCYGTMCHHLSHVHLPPLPLGCGLQLVDPCGHLVYGLLLK
jgi:hypothetical protein